MGNSTTAPAHCPECREAFRPPPTRKKGERTTCGYCREFFTAMNGRVREVEAFSSHEFGPMHAPGEGGADYSGTFTGGVRKVTPQTGSLCVLGRAQSDPDHVGSFWHANPVGTMGALRHDCAISARPPVANQMQTLASLAVPPGIFFAQSVARSQSSRLEHLPGGGLQCYIPAPVVATLWPASSAFLSRELSRASYAAFVKDCAPAFAAQAEWWRGFEALRAAKNAEAARANALREGRAELAAATAPGTAAAQALRRAERAAKLARAALDGAEGDDEADAHRLGLEAQVVQLVATQLLEMTRPAGYTLEEWVEVEAFGAENQPGRGNLIKNCPKAIRELLRSGGGGRGRLDDSHEGKPFAIHGVGAWVLEATLTLDRVTVETRGRTEVTTYHYTAALSWRRA